MKFFAIKRESTLALAVLAAFSLTACQVPSKTAEIAAPSVITPKQVDPRITQHELAQGLYEIVYSPKADVLYVASAQGFKTSTGGVLYRLDPSTLATMSEIHTDLKNFGLVMDPDGSAIYITNTADGGITKIDAQSGKVLQRLMFKEQGKKGKPAGTREIIWNQGLLYVGGASDPGVIWIVDAKTMQIKKTISNVGNLVTGIIYSPLTKRIYAANGNAEILVINPENHTIENRWKTGDDKEYLFMNLAEDPSTGRLFVTDNAKAKTTLVFDERTGRVLKRIDGDGLGIRFNAKRNEIYISQRQSKKVLQLDATTYAIKNSWSFDSYPNSLEVSPDGETLFVSLKSVMNKDHSAKGQDSIVRITMK